MARAVKSARKRPARKASAEEPEGTASPGRLLILVDGKEYRYRILHLSPEDLKQVVTRAEALGSPPGFHLVFLPSIQAYAVEAEETSDVDLASLLDGIEPQDTLDDDYGNYLTAILAAYKTAPSVPPASHEGSHTEGRG